MLDLCQFKNTQWVQIWNISSPWNCCTQTFGRCCQQVNSVGHSVSVTQNWVPFNTKSATSYYSSFQHVVITAALLTNWAPGRSTCIRDATPLCQMMLSRTHFDWQRTWPDFCAHRSSQCVLNSRCMLFAPKMWNLTSSVHEQCCHRCHVLQHAPQMPQNCKVL